MHHVSLEIIISNQIKSYRGNDFQEFGDRLLSKLYPDEYIAVRAGGIWGDLKNDGYCYINRIFFHFYGTSQHNVNALKRKITADIEGCLAKQQQVKKIVYVTNDSNLGIIEAHIDMLRFKHNIPIETWGPNKLVEIIGVMSLRDIGSILKIALNSEITSITYAIDKPTIKSYSRKEVNIKATIALSSLITFLVTLFALYNVVSLGYYLGIVGVLFLVFLCFKWYLFLPVNTQWGEWQNGANFYIKEAENYKRYRKKAICPYPQCNGVIYLGDPPVKETNRFEIIGYCSLNRTIHTFSYNKEDIGYPVTLNFEPLETK